MADEKVLQTITTETSKKGTINKLDLLRSSLTSLYAYVGLVLVQFLDGLVDSIKSGAGVHFDLKSLLIALIGAVVMWLADLVRRSRKDSATVIRVVPGLAEVKTASDPDKPRPKPGDIDYDPNNP